MRAARSILPILLVFVVLVTLTGCATRETTVSTSGEYRKMLELQKQRNDAIDREMAPKRLPEMSADDHDGLGDRYMRQGDATHAFLEYRKALVMKPGLVLTRYKVGRLFLEKGLADEAMKEFDIVEKTDPHNGLSHLGKGMVCFRKGDLKPARSQFEGALSLDERLWEAHAFLGLILDRDKETTERAREHYKKGIALNPGSVELYNNLGISYYLQGDYTQAVAAYRKALCIDPSSRRVYNNLGLALTGTGEYKDAFEAFKRGKDTAGAYNNIGYLYFMERKYGEAIEALEKAIELKPSFYAKAHENMDMVVTGTKTGE
jgi:tetratricopeptide (TPR) repeat protein